MTDEQFKRTYTVVITHDNETARLSCESWEEAFLLRRSFINYGKYQEVKIEVIDKN